jgi:hypothetical protein
VANIITVLDLENFMGREFTPEEEVQAAAIIESVTAVIEDEVDASFEFVEDDVMITQADGHGILEFNERPIVDVTSVTKVDETEVDGWEFDGLSTIYNLWPNQVVIVTYSHGFETVPRAIKTVALGMASRIVYNPAGLRQETVGAISVTYPGIGGEAGTVNLSALERKILERYKVAAKSMRLDAARRRNNSLSILTLDNDID